MAMSQQSLCTGARMWDEACCARSSETQSLRERHSCVSYDRSAGSVVFDLGGRTYQMNDPVISVNLCVTPCFLSWGPSPVICEIRG